MGALLGFIGGFITGQIFLICVAVIGAGREDKEAPTKEEWKQEDYRRDFRRKQYGSTPGIHGNRFLQTNICLQQSSMQTYWWMDALKKS